MLSKPVLWQAKGAVPCREGPGHVLPAVSEEVGLVCLHNDHVE